MENYEILSDNLKIKWLENFVLANQKYTQVSGYVFNQDNQLLIVKNGKTWTIPGGHPESEETPVQTLKRELMEEACVTLEDLRFLGAVEVVEKNKTYYQLRYFARVKEVLPFEQDFEISERAFVPLAELPNYIKWANGVTFKKQLDSASKFL